MTLTLRQLLDAWGTPQGGSFEPDALLGRVCTDSRQLQAGDFFVPLVGERFDGHHFLDQLPQYKVQAAVVSRSWTEPLPSGLLHWRVDDTLLAYQGAGWWCAQSDRQKSPTDSRDRGTGC